MLYPVAALLALHQPNGLPLPPNRARSPQLNVLRALEFWKANFYADGGKLFSRSCNIVVDHFRKNTVDKHVNSKKHVEKALKKPTVDENRNLRIQTLKTVVNARTDAEYARKELAIDLSEALLAANIPLEKLDHPAICRFLEDKVPGSGSIPRATGNDC